MLVVKGRSIGTRKQLFEDFSVPLPPSVEGGSTKFRDLIAAVVKHEVELFHKRQTDRQFIRVLTQTEIDENEQTGKIESGGSELSVQKVDVDQAVSVAIEAFEDGLFLTFIDGTEQKDLDADVLLTPKSEMTFIRLTMLAGG